MKKFFTDIEIDRLKAQFSIVDYLDSKGFEPVERIKSEWLYQSMGSNENTPSFYVNVAKNVYYDYSSNRDNTGECGDIIRLVRCLEKLQFIDACNFLMKGEFTPYGQIPPTTPLTEEKKGIQVLNVQSIRRAALIEYIARRRISFRLANNYLKEIDYQSSGNRYFALGFKNDKGGYALRSSIFKGQTMPQHYTTLPAIETDTINIFEGFFSMLSCLEIYKHECFKYTTYVLNSVTNLNRLIPHIPERIKKINVFFDNDEAGRKALLKLQDLDLYTVVDNSIHYQGFKDFNEKLLTV